MRLTGDYREKGLDGTVQPSDPALGVQPFDLLREMLLHDAAAQLERRRDLVLLGAEVACRIAKRLICSKRERSRLTSSTTPWISWRTSSSPARSSSRASLPPSPFRTSGSSSDQRSDVRLFVAEHDRLGDVLRRLQVVLDVLRGATFLPPAGDEDVLLAVGDRHEAVLVDRRDVAGGEPAVVVDDRTRPLGILVVAREDGRAANEELTVFGEA